MNNYTVKSAKAYDSRGLIWESGTPVTVRSGDKLTISGSKVDGFKLNVKRPSLLKRFITSVR